MASLQLFGFVDEVVSVFLCEVDRHWVTVRVFIPTDNPIALLAKRLMAPEGMALPICCPATQGPQPSSRQGSLNVRPDGRKSLVSALPGGCAVSRAEGPDDLPLDATPWRP